MPLATLGAVPAAPLILHAAVPRPPGAVRDHVRALRSDVAAALDTLDLRRRRSVVLLAAGDEPLVHAPRRATLASYGLPAVERPVAVDVALLEAIAARGQASRVQGERLDGDLAVLALAVGVVAPELPVVPMTVPRRASADALTGVAAGLAHAATSVDGEVTVLAAGDLAATLDTISPGYLVDGADDWDAAVVAAVTAGDLAVLAAHGPGSADDVQARGWAPLTVLVALAATARRSFVEARYHAPRGVGQLVAWSDG